MTLKWKPEGDSCPVPAKYSDFAQAKRRQFVVDFAVASLCGVALTGVVLSVAGGKLVDSDALVSILKGGVISSLFGMGLSFVAK
mmetsp:Transcript_28625/g.57715  ORF Transcript_28625/g.57715 Transcript_28625/m.57715 type:complete len:84 (-) Transcript_28625:149-400(-)